MTVERSVEVEIRRLYFAEHWRKGTICTQLGVHRDVVDRVVGPLGPEPKNAEPRQTLLDPYAPFVMDVLERYPRLVSTRLYDMLLDRGYVGSLRTLRRFVAEHRPRRARRAFVRLETLAGEQSQIDWAHVGQLRVKGGVRPLYCFVILLRHSRAMWAELVLEQTTASLVRSLVRAAEYFGGVTHEWLFDNPKSIVAAREGSAIRFAPALVELAGALHVSLRACRVRTPTDKGGVERGIRYLKGRFFAARTISSLDAGNAALLDFLENIAAARPHPVQRERAVADVFADERERLLPLPSASLPTDLITSVRVDKTALVTFDTNRYSVPPEHVERTLTLVANDREVRLLSGSDVVARHQRGQRRPARLAQQQRALRVDVVEHDLGRGALRFVALHHLAHTFEDDLQPRGQVASGHFQRADGAAGHVGQARALGVHDPEPGLLQAGVDAEDAGDAHGRLCCAEGGPGLRRPVNAGSDARQ